MRLTLRTLLAYLDDILEPSQAKEIGAKIAESDVASSLSNRIREVMRQRRLTAPELSGPSSGVDPNVVAEYLDNTLSPDLVADLEKICLDSDVHLAEVAASHQILTLVLGEPVEISTQSRERMYALAPPPRIAAADTEAAAVSPRTNGESVATTTDQEANAQKPKPAKSFHDTIPDYLKRKPLGKRMFPFVVVIALLGAFFGLVLTDEGLFPDFFGSGSQQVAQSEKTADGNAADGKTADGKTLAMNTPVKTLGSKIPVPPEKKTAETVPPKKTGLPMKGIDPPPPPDAATNGSNSPSVVGKKPPVVLPDGPKVAVTPTKKTPGKTPTAKRPKLPVVAGKAPSLQFQTPGNLGLILRESVADKDWSVLTTPTPLAGNERFVSPEPFDSAVDIGGGQAVLTLIGGSAMRILPANPAAVYGLEVDHGRVVIRSKSIPTVNEPDARVFGLVVHGRLWRIELTSPGTVCGIEVEPQIAYGLETGPGPIAFKSTVFAFGGTVRVATQDGEKFELKGDADHCVRLSLSPIVQPKKQPAAKTASPRIAVASTPSWLTPAGRRKSKQIESYGRYFHNEFKQAGNTLDALAGKRPMLHDHALEIVKDRRPQVAEFAGKALAAAGSPVVMMQALLRSQHEEARTSVVLGLRRWLAADVARGKQLRTILARLLPAADADAVYRLLWGFTEKDARDPGISLELVEWLEHRDDSIRELAFDNIYRLTKRRYGYRPLMAASQRGLSLGRWRAHLAKNGALLLPEKTE